MTKKVYNAEIGHSRGGPWSCWKPEQVDSSLTGKMGPWLLASTPEHIWVWLCNASLTVWCIEYIPKWKFLLDLKDRLGIDFQLSRWQYKINTPFPDHNVRYRWEVCKIIFKITLIIKHLAPTHSYNFVYCDEIWIWVPTMIQMTREVTSSPT